MATIRSAFTDHSLLDDTGDDINGSEVDANPYLLADILDGTTATQLNQSGSMVVLNPEVTDVSAAAGGIRTALRVRHDPASGTVTAGDGPRILFEADDSAGNKTTIGEIRVPWVTPTDGSGEASNMELLARVANASVEMLSLGSDGFIFNESGADLDYRFEADNNTSLVSFDAGMFTGVGAVGFGSAAVNTGVVTIDPPAMTAIANTNIARLNIENTAAITVPTGTTSIAASVFIGEPNLTATGTITSAVTLYIQAAPTEGGTDNHALWVDSGSTRLDGTLRVDDAVTLNGASVTVADNLWIGLGGSDGRIEFDNQTTDEINFLNCYVGIGTSTPTNTVDIGGGAALGCMLMVRGGTGPIASFEATVNTTGILNVQFIGITPDNNTQGFLTCSDATATRLQIWADGDVQNHDNSYGALSDANLKQNRTDARDYWEDWKQIQFCKYRFKSDVAADENAPYQIGVIAQEIETVFPSLVSEDEHGVKGFKYSVLNVIACKVLQEAIERIEALETP